MDPAAPPVPPAKSGALKRMHSRFREWLARDGLNPWTAEFKDQEREADFQSFLVEKQLPKERLIDFAGVALFSAYGLLDILTITQDLGLILLLRWAVFVPIAALLVSLTYIDRFKPLFGHITAAVMFLFANLVVVMIVLMQPVGAPPYLVGVLFVFIFCSCVQRIQFRVALAAFVMTGFNYATLITLDSGISEADRVSGIAFMVSFILIAAATSYVREIEARQVWRREEQKRLDAIHIEELLIEATAADRSKNNFLSILSHELRTPLHQIVGFAGLVKTEMENPKSTDATDFLDQIHDSAHELLGRIGKMLRYADATAGKIEYDMDDCDIRDLVETIVYDLQAQAEEASVLIETDGVAAKDLRLDLVHSKYAITNLIENAVNASSPGQRILITGAEQEGGVYCLKIADEGCGISERQIELAFSPFSQIADPHTRAKEGIGLGLPLAQKIFNDQGATLSINSEPEKGTTVTVLFTSQSIARAA